MTRRIGWFWVSWDVVLTIAASRDPSSTWVTSTLPPDASVTYIEVDHERRAVKVYYESAQLEPVAEVDAIPMVEPRLTTHYPPAEAVA